MVKIEHNSSNALMFFSIKQGGNAVLKRVWRTCFVPSELPLPRRRFFILLFGGFSFFFFQGHFFLFLVMVKIEHNSSNALMFFSIKQGGNAVLKRVWRTCFVPSELPLPRRRFSLIIDGSLTRSINSSSTV